MAASILQLCFQSVSDKFDVYLSDYSFMFGCVQLNNNHTAFVSSNNFFLATF